MFAAIKGLKENSVSGNLNGTMTFHVRRDGQDGNTDSERMRITSVGNVGIGTTSPDQKLSVNGDANKASGGTSWAAWSDIRLKTVEGYFKKGLKEILQINPFVLSNKIL
jgi:hypothetical protein